MKSIFILLMVMGLASGCNKKVSGTCTCADKKEAVLKIYHDIQCVTTPCFRHELILSNGETAIIQNISEFQLEEVNQKVAYCADVMNLSYPPQLHVTCLETLDKNITATPCAQNESVVIEDKTGLDGCGWVLKKTNGEYLEPVNINQYQSALKSGNVANISYEWVNDMGSICMIGKMVKICSLEITQTAK